MKTLAAVLVLLAVYFASSEALPSRNVNVNTNNNNNYNSDYLSSSIFNSIFSQLRGGKSSAERTLTTAQITALLNAFNKPRGTEQDLAQLDQPSADQNTAPVAADVPVADASSGPVVIPASDPIAQETPVADLPANPPVSSEGLLKSLMAAKVREMIKSKQ